jgi:hypothetical protein
MLREKQDWLDAPVKGPVAAILERHIYFFIGGPAAGTPLVRHAPGQQGPGAWMLSYTFCIEALRLRCVE